jgi:hypothetical protein
MAWTFKNALLYNSGLVASVSVGAVRRLVVVGLRCSISKTDQGKYESTHSAVVEFVVELVASGFGVTPYQCPISSIP